LSAIEKGDIRLKRKTAQKKRAKNNYVRGLIKRILKIFWLILIIGGVLVFIVDFRSSSWDGKHTLNFVELDNNEIVFYSFHPQERVLNKIIFPQNLFISTAKGLGEYKINNIYKLGEMEKIGGGKLLTYSLQNLLGIPIDGWLVKKKFFLSETNFSWWDRIRIFYFRRELKPNDINEIDLRQAGLIVQEELPDNSRILKLEVGRTQEFCLRFLTDSNILNENMRVQVVNGTKRTSLGKNAALLARGIGVQIVNIRDGDEFLNKTAIFFNRETETLKRLAKIFKTDRLEQKEDLESDIVLIVGDDFWKEFYSF